MHATFLNILLFYYGYRIREGIIQEYLTLPTINQQYLTFLLDSQSCDFSNETCLIDAPGLL